MHLSFHRLLCLLYKGAVSSGSLCACAVNLRKNAYMFVSYDKPYNVVMIKPLYCLIITLYTSCTVSPYKPPLHGSQ